MVLVVVLAEDLADRDDHGDVGGDGEEAVVDGVAKHEHVRGLVHEAQDAGIDVGPKTDAAHDGDDERIAREVGQAHLAEDACVRIELGARVHAVQLPHGRVLAQNLLAPRHMQLPVRLRDVLGRGLGGRRG